ncbi:phosphate ABC transporter permease subunit PstC [Hyphomicrobium sp.]|uniref:phosphate ABC transporter permease subunit PstC n=1 Tax=Hyphomicrobium sp. TaxID=82 RepID=UPI0013267D9B|nr:phosphate ABC transporter permease subunit PstC [Hyphomicrobium sp.]KAB2937247.1 MAG: phosphate ABC transporter permease subunit PstC [Hyphomicrobium sp.]
MAGMYFVSFALLVVAGFLVARSRAHGLASGNLGSLHSLPIYHGLFTAVAVLVPMLVVFAIGAPLVIQMATSNALSYFGPEVAADALRRGAALRDIQNVVNGQHGTSAISEALRKAADSYASTLRLGNWIVYGSGVGLGLLGLVVSLGRIGPGFRSRNYFERFVLVVLMACAAVAIMTTIGIIFSVVIETYRFFFDPALKGRPTIVEFLFGTEWNPQEALRADQGDIKTAFGFIPLLTGTVLITFIAICVAGPLGLFSAIYLSEYASRPVRAWAKPVLEILAGIPTVVLGFFAALTVAPFIRGWGEYFGLDVASESALAAGLVMGMMIIPFISSLSDDVINAVPQSLRDGAYGLGSTKSEAIRKVVLPAALPGIVSAFMLAISRAIGETMIVVMAAGLAANLTFNPLEAVTTITVQIKTILVGDQEFDSAKTLAAFALGFVLFFVTLMLNMVALHIVNKYREQYD